MASQATMLSPVLWIGIEYLRYLLTGNDWNALGYSQAFVPVLVQPAKYGSFFLVGFLIAAFNALIFLFFIKRNKKTLITILSSLIIIAGLIFLSQPVKKDITALDARKPEALVPAALVIAVQPNVPMSGLSETEWDRLRAEQGEMAERAWQARRAAGFPP